MTGGNATEGPDPGDAPEVVSNAVPVIDIPRAPSANRPTNTTPRPTAETQDPGVDATNSEVSVEEIDLRDDPDNETPNDPNDVIKIDRGDDPDNETPNDPNDVIKIDLRAGRDVTTDDASQLDSTPFDPFTEQADPAFDTPRKRTPFVAFDYQVESTIEPEVETDQRIRELEQENARLTQLVNRRDPATDAAAEEEQRLYREVLAADRDRLEDEVAALTSQLAGLRAEDLPRQLPTGFESDQGTALGDEIAELKTKNVALTVQLTESTHERESLERQIAEQAIAVETAELALAEALEEGDADQLRFSTRVDRLKAKFSRREASLRARVVAQTERADAAESDLLLRVDAAALTTEQMQSELATAAERETELQTQLGTAAERETELQSELATAAERETELQTQLGTAAERETELQADLAAELTAQIESSQEELRSELSAATQRVEELEKDAAAAQATIERADDKLQQAREAAEEHTAQIDKLHQRITTATADKTALQTKLEEVEQQRDAAESGAIVDRLENELGAMQEQNAILDGERHGAEVNAAQLTNRLTRVSNKNETLRNDRDQLLKETNRLETALSKAKRDLSAERERANRLETSNDSLARDRDASERDRTGLSTALAAANADRAELSQIVADLRRELSEVRAELGGHTGQIEEAIAQAAATLDQLEDTRDLLTAAQAENRRLSKQAERAVGDLESLRSNQTGDVGDLHEQLRTATHAHLDAQQELNGARRALAEKDDELAKATTERGELAGRLDASVASESKLGEQLAEAEQEIVDLRRRVESAVDQRADTDRRLALERSEHMAVERERAEALARLTKIAAERDELALRVTQLRTRVTSIDAQRVTISDELEETDSERTTLQHALAAQTEFIDKLDADRTTAVEIAENLRVLQESERERADQLSEQLATVDAELARERQRSQEAAAELQDLSAKLAQSDQAGTTLSTERDRLVAEQDALRIHLTEVTADRDELHQDLERQLERHAETARELGSLQRLSNANTEDAQRNRDALHELADRHRATELENRELRTRLDENSTLIGNARAAAQLELEKLQMRVEVLTDDRQREVKRANALQRELTDQQQRMQESEGQSSERVRRETDLDERLGALTRRIEKQIERAMNQPAQPGETSSDSKPRSSLEADLAQLERSLTELAQLAREQGGLADPS